MHRDANRDAEAAFYRRQVALPFVGAAGQRRLRQSSVLVVGAGGLGCPALAYLAAAGVGRIVIADGDTVDATNLHRQVLYAHADVGRRKAEVAAERLRAHNPFIEVLGFPVAVAPENLGALLPDQDAVLDCTDNFAAKYLLHDACHLAGIPLAMASIHRMEGQLQVFRPGADAGCLRCLWPEVPPPGCVGTCAEDGVLGVVPGILGAWQASEALKILLGMPGVADREVVRIDLAGNALSRLVRRRDPACPLCGASPRIRGIDPAEYAPVPPWQIGLATLSDAELRACRIIDVRSPGEHAAGPAAARALDNIPAQDLPALLALPRGPRYLLVCARGLRSAQAAARLREAGRDDVFALREGAEALSARL
jgi:adenylyltransferase/sulfurtransferase